jgi:hypothetical protein
MTLLGKKGVRMAQCNAAGFLPRHCPECKLSVPHKVTGYWIGPNRAFDVWHSVGMRCPVAKGCQISIRLLEVS